MEGLKFGTSGLRGLAAELDGPAATAWTQAFLQHLEASGRKGSRELLVGVDLRASSPSIAAHVAAGAAAEGWSVGDAGALPTPALALEAGRRGAAAIMVTGSHIPEERNGLKFYRPGGFEIDKDDESAIRAAHETLALTERDVDPAATQALGNCSEEARAAYVERYARFFGRSGLTGLRVGVYEQSSVGRDILAEILERVGASVEPLARSETFVPVDTEAHRPEDLELLAEWGASGRFDAIVSTDGDADRPLVADETGTVVRGDILGLITAAHLGLGAIVTPVTSTSALERSPFARRVVRTKVGSPYVIAAMEKLQGTEDADALGFEANGGVLLGAPLDRGAHRLEPLLTRDAMLPILCALAETAGTLEPLSHLVRRLDAGFTASERLKDVPAEHSRPFLDRLRFDPTLAAELFGDFGTLARLSDIDGVRLIFENQRVVHFRASGNAPELRCYVEAESADAAASLLAFGLTIARERTALAA